MVRQSISGEKPTVEALLACEWFDCPADLRLERGREDR
jgi:hypothetical protein